MTATKLDTRQSVNRTALGMVGSGVNASLDSILALLDPEIAKLFEDRNLLLVDGGQITFTGTAINFSEALKLHVNSRVAGGSPVVIDLAATTRTLSASGRMVYAVINRTAGTATVTDDSTTLPTQTSANQEVVLLAKRVDAGDGTKRCYFRNGTTIDEGKTVRLGASGSGSGGGGISYINNPDAEGGVTGYAAYADAAGAAPVDGTGGSPTVTITRTTSSPLRGNGSFLITKDAANRQGEGVSYAFTIDRADQAKPLKISFDYEIASGTYSGGSDSTNSDLLVYIYDVTNSVLIQPAPYKLPGSVAGVQYKFQAEFQSASNSTSYRLIVHTATTSASAYTFKFDNVQLGPQAVQFGAPIGDWKAFTPTSAWTATHTGYWRRVGDSAEIKINITCTGAPSGTLNTIGFSQVGVIDTAKLLATTTNQTLIGYGVAEDVGVQGYPVEVLYINSTTVSLRPIRASGTYGDLNDLVNATVPFSFGSTDFVEFTFFVPIVGWGTSVVMSNDTDTRVVAMTVTGTLNSVTAGNPLTVSTITNTVDTHGGYNSATGRYTVPMAGIYEVTFLANSSATSGVLQAYLDGSLSLAPSMGYVLSSGIGWGTTLLKCNAGQIIDVRLSTNTGGGATGSGLSVRRLSGPSSIAASEYIAAKYNTTTQSITTSYAVVNATTKEFDTHGAYSAGVFTAPSPGTYRVSGSAFNESTSGVGDRLYLTARKNSTVISALGTFTHQTTSSVGQTITGSVLIKCVAGDTLDVVIKRDTGVAATSIGSSNDTNAQQNWVSFERVGN